MNQVAFIGRIARPVDLKSVNNQTSVLNNTLAISRRFKSENGQDVDFIPFTAWGKTGELISNYCRKGDLVGLTGRMQSRSYENNAHEKVYVVELIVDEVQFLQPKSAEVS